MKYPLLAAVFFFTFASVLFAQQATPTPTPSNPDDDVVRISTNLIQIDVVVTDSRGKIVTDLKPSEIEIYENGRKQALTNFSFVSSVRAAESKPKEVDNSSVPIPTAELKAEKVRRTFALVVDDLSLSFESAYQTRRALKKFVDEQMQDGDLVAIIRTGAGIGALQQFTSDKRMLYAAIERVKWNPLGSGGISAFAPIEAAPDTSLQSDGSTASDTAGDGSEMGTGSGQSLEDFRSSVFATGTLGALKYIVTGMTELPGRKSVILFSDGFKLLETDDNGSQTSGRVMDFVRELIDAANRSSVVFYTIDPRGLQYTGPTAADNISDASGQALSSIMSRRSQQLFDTQQGLAYLAHETGGFDIKNSNDLAGGVRQVLDDQSYYLVAYEPDSDTFDPVARKFNKLEVKVLRKGMTARYRSGFYNRPTVETARTNPALTPAQQIQTALTSPFGSRGITLRLNALFGNDAARGSFVRSLLHVDANDLTYTDAKDGTKTATFDILAASFGDNGAMIDQLSRRYTLSIKPANLKKLQESGFVYRFTFPVKKAGAFQYRVAIRDAESQKVGSASQFVEVPDLKKSRLTLSGLVLESVTEGDWKKLGSSEGQAVKGDSSSDTALRRMKVGTVLRYGFEIYNAKGGQANKPQLNARVRVFHDGKIVLDGRPMDVDTSQQKDLARIRFSGALSLGGKMEAGDYILQLIVTDRLAKAKRQVATQYVQFELEK